MLLLGVSMADSDGNSSRLGGAPISRERAEVVGRHPLYSLFLKDCIP